MERGRHRWWSREGADGSGGLPYTVCTFRLLCSSYFKCCQVPAVILLFFPKVLIHLILLKVVGEEDDCANLPVLWFRWDSHHLGALSDFKCNILLKCKAVYLFLFCCRHCNFNICKTQPQNTSDPAQSSLLFKRHNSHTYQYTVSLQHGNLDFFSFLILFFVPSFTYDFFLSLGI